MAENTDKIAESQKRPPVKKRVLISEKYTEPVLAVCYHTGDFTLSLLKQIPMFLVALLSLIKKAAGKFEDSSQAFK